MNGWGKIKVAAEYAGVSERTMWDWLKQGLRHSRLPSGHVLIAYSDIDAYLRRFQVDNDVIENAVDEIFNSMKSPASPCSRQRKGCHGGRGGALGPSM